MDIPKLPEGSNFLERFRIDKFLGEGGMGAVYLATQISLNRQVAIKVLARTAALSDNQARFQREASALCLLHHPNIVQFLEYAVTSEGLCYIVMEHVQGRSLSNLLQARNSLSWQEACKIIIQV